jgi:hypothetical protein
VPRRLPQQSPDFSDKTPPLNDLETWACALIHAHLEPVGLSWRFRWTRGIKQLGVCRFERLGPFSSAYRVEIGLSRQHAQEGDFQQVRDTLLHEIAHALAGPGQGHNRVWQAHCLRIGAQPKACAPLSVVKSAFIYYLVYPAERRIAACSNRRCQWVKRPQDFQLRGCRESLGQLEVWDYVRAQSQGLLD